MNVIKELGFSPNVYASLLASKKHHLIVCILPEFMPGEFWDLTRRGIMKGADDVAKFGVDVEIIYYDQYMVESFKKACVECLRRNPSAVILPPMFKDETLNFVGLLKERGVSYVYIDSKIEEDDYLAYFGLPMYQSGYLCANILTSGQDVRKIYMIRLMRDKNGLSDPTQTRRHGFQDYVKEHYPECEMVSVFIDGKDREGTVRTLDGMFEKDRMPGKMLVMFNSRVHIIADYLKLRDIHDCRVVGFDVVAKNLDYLREGYIQMLIAQHCEQQAALAISCIVEKIVMLRNLPKRDYYTQMDILNRYNCDYYL